MLVRVFLDQEIHLWRGTDYVERMGNLINTCEVVDFEDFGTDVFATNLADKALFLD